MWTELGSSPVKFWAFCGTWKYGRSPLCVELAEKIIHANGHLLGHCLLYWWNAFVHSWSFETNLTALGMQLGTDPQKLKTGRESHKRLDLRRVREMLGAQNLVMGKQTEHSQLPGFIYCASYCQCFCFLPIDVSDKEMNSNYIPTSVFVLQVLILKLSFPLQLLNEMVNFAFRSFHFFFRNHHLDHFCVFITLQGK